MKIEIRNEIDKQIIVLDGVRFCREVAIYKERKALRRVFENARSVLRNYGIDTVRFTAAINEMDENCEKVKRMDDGNDDA